MRRGPIAAAVRACGAQIAEVDKLNAIINQTEKEMLKLRKQYEVRAPAGVWCILNSPRRASR